MTDTSFNDSTRSVNGERVCRHTPHLDAVAAEQCKAYNETLSCECRHRPQGKTPDRTAWLKKHGFLCRKRTARGWRRAWQCKICLRDMGGDGKNAGPPTEHLPEYIERDHPDAVWVRDMRLSAYDRAKPSAAARREAWFKDHDLYLQTPQWQALRQQVLSRDKSRCVNCGRHAEHVHHMTYERWQYESLDDLVSLCRVCHEKEHGR